MAWEITETRFMVSMLILLFIIASIFIAYYTVRAFRWRLVDRWSALTTLGISVTLIFFIGSPFKNGYILVPPFLNYLITWTAIWTVVTIIYFIFKNKPTPDIPDARPEDWVVEKEELKHYKRKQKHPDANVLELVHPSKEDSFHVTGQNSNATDELQNEVKRKIPHIISSTTVLCYLYVGAELAHIAWKYLYGAYPHYAEEVNYMRSLAEGPMLEAGAAAAIVMFLGMFFFTFPTEMLRLKYPKQRHFMDFIIVSTMRKRERGIFVAYFYFLLSIAYGVIFLTFFSPGGNFHIFAPMGLIMICAMGDSAAALIGRRFGKHKISFNARKSWEGLVAGFAASWLGAAVFVGIPLALIGALVFVFIDLITPRLPITDNILNPLFVSAVFLAGASLLAPMIPMY